MCYTNKHDIDIDIDIKEQSTKEMKIMLFQTCYEEHKWRCLAEGIHIHCKQKGQLNSANLHLGSVK